MHSYAHSRPERPGVVRPLTEEEKAEVPPVEHPLVRFHPNGQPSLYIGLHAEHIPGMGQDESRQLLDELVAFATQPRFVYRHHWTPRDLVIWDNRCTLHRALPYVPLGKRRVMRRVTICGTGPAV